jgi:hypothetical protein
MRHVPDFVIGKNMPVSADYFAADRPRRGYISVLVLIRD